MPQIYSKSSFDRFGDDLNEVILSYLSFSDKVCFESVSKQWKRCVYQKQYRLTVNDEVMSKLRQLKDNRIISQRIETMLQKLNHLNSIDFRFQMPDNKDDEMLIKLIMKYCRHLNEFKYDFNRISAQTLNEFFKKFGSNLKTIGFVTNTRVLMRENFSFCSQLKELHIRSFGDLSVIFNERNEILVKKLKKITFQYNDEDIDKFESLVANNNGLEVISISARQLNQNAVKVLMNGLTQLPHLKQLDLNIFRNVFDITLVDQIKRIGLNCMKLEKLHIFAVSGTSAVSYGVYQSIKHYKQLRRLELSLIPVPEITEGNKRITNKTNGCLTVETLSQCKDLSFLKLSLLPLPISDQFFFDIQRHLPKLYYLEVYNLFYVLDKSLEFVSKLPKLQTLKLIPIYNRLSGISDASVVNLIDKCPKLKTIVIRNYKNAFCHLKDEDIEIIRQY